MSEDFTKLTLRGNFSLVEQRPCLPRKKSARSVDCANPRGDYPGACKFCRRASGSAPYAAARSRAARTSALRCCAWLQPFSKPHGWCLSL